MPIPETIDHFELDVSTDQVSWTAVNHAIAAAARAIDEPLPAGVNYWRLTGVTNLANRFTYNIVSTQAVTGGPGDVLWAALAGQALTDTSQGSCTDASGNIYVTGSSGSGGAPYPYVAKFSPTGSLLWQRTYSSVGNGEPVYAVAVDALGHVFVTGSYSTRLSEGVTNLLTLGGEHTVWVGKLDAATGNWLTGAEFKSGASSIDSQAGRAIAVDSSGNVYIAGIACKSITINGTTYTSDGTDVLIIKLSNDLAVQWAKVVDSTNPGGGGDREDRAFGIALDSNSNVYVVGDWGSFQNSINFGPLPGDALVADAVLSNGFIVKYNSAGVYQWSRKVSTAGTPAFSRTQCTCCVVKNNALYVGSDAHTARRVSKYDLNGTLIWEKNFGSDDRNNPPALKGIHVTNSGVVVATGLLWGTMDIGNGVPPITNNYAYDWFVAAFTDNVSTATGKWLRRFAASNAGQGNVGGEYGTSVTTNGDLLYVLGLGTGVFDFGNGVGITTRDNPNSSDIILLRMVP